MARKPRVHYEGALYHVICRGNNRAYVFDNNESKKNYIEIIEHYKKKYGFKLFCYCLMDNHVHLLIEVSKEPLSKIMKCIQQVYTQRYNKQHKRSGHVFEQRYKAILCDKDQYLLGLINYIHMNPERAGKVEGIDYRWSSHQVYLKNDNSFVDVDFPLSLFEGSKTQQLERYINFMKFEEDHIGKMKANDFSDDMIDLVKEKLNIEKEDEKKNELDPQEIIYKVCLYYGIEETGLKEKTRKEKIVLAKRVSVHLIKKYGNHTNRDIGRMLNMSATAVSFALNDESLQVKIRNEIECIGISGA